MMDLKMEVYSPYLELLGLLEIQNSVIWERKAFSSGSFSLTSLITEESKALLIRENIIWIAGEDAGIIEYIQEEVGEDGPYITVKGCDLTGILARRILWGRYDLNGPVPELMYRLVDDCCINPTRGNSPKSRVIPGLVLAGTAPVGGQSIRAQKTGGDLLEALEKLGETYQVSFGVRFNPAVPQMEFWARYGVNRAVNQNVVEPVFYSTELDDVLSSEYSYNSQDYRNVALVAGEGEGNDRVHVTVDAGSEQPAQTIVGFVVLGDTNAMRTSDGKAFKAIALTADGDSYQSAYTGPQIDEAIRRALSGEGGGGGSSVVSSFNGRTDAVVPQSGDYTAKQVSFSKGTLAMVAENVQDAISELFISVSDGKSLVASAITDKGVETAADATFQTMHNNILAIESGSKVPDKWKISTLPSAPSGSEWREVAFGNGRFVAVAYNSNQAAYSEDNGVTWKASTLPLSAQWRQIAFGNGRFVTVAQNSNKAAYSDDGGETWKAATLPSSTHWTAITFGNGRFVTVAQASNKAAYSNDGGETWQVSTLPSSLNWNTVTYGNGIFVTIAINTTSPIAKFAYSTNSGVSWTASSLPHAAYWSRVSYGNDMFVAISWTSYYSVSGAPKRPYISPGVYGKNATSWTATYMPSPAKWNNIAFGNGMFVAVSLSMADNADASDLIAYSKDGACWAAVKLPLAAVWYGIACGNSRFVAIATNGKCAYTE